MENIFYKKLSILNNEQVQFFKDFDKGQSLGFFFFRTSVKLLMKNNIYQKVTFLPFKQFTFI